MGVCSKSVIVGILAVFCAGIAVPLYADVGATGSAWLNRDVPEFTKVKELPAGKEPPYSINDRIDCEWREITTRPRYGTTPPLTQQACVVEAQFGSVTTTGHMKVPGTSIYGKPKHTNGASMGVMPIPRASYALSLDYASYAGSYMYITPNYADAYDVYPVTYGEREFRLKHGIERIPIKDEQGKFITFKYASMSYSSNARYVAADSAIHGTVRIDTETQEALVFATTINYFVGSGSVGTTISGDGRYVLVANSAGQINIHDLASCGTESVNQYGMKKCSSKDIRPDMVKKIPGFVGATTFRFIDNHTVSFWATVLKDGVRNRVQYLMNPAGMTPVMYEYLALGDSFASGEGAHKYKSYTDTKDNRCHVSTISYPYLIADQMSMSTSESVSCSGAKIKDIDGSQISSQAYNERFRQSKGKEDRFFDDEIYNNFLTGYRHQTEFIHRKKPTAVTISTVGNDIGFGDIIKKCIGPGTCYDTYEDRYELMALINSQFDRLTTMYAELKQANDPRAKFYVLGYPKLVKPGGNCANNVHLNSDELQFANDLVAYLNDMIEAATQKTGVFYVDVETAFENYRLCENDSWNIAVNGLTAGDDMPFGTLGPFANESYHPNGFGHSLYKTVVLAKTNNLTVPMPEPNTNSKAPLILPTNPLLANKRKSNRGLNTVLYDHSLTADNLERSGHYELKADGSYKLKPDSVYNAYLYSEPISLGTVKTDGSGALVGSITIPEKTESGFHTLHLFGQNIASEPIDIQKVVYVNGDTTTCSGFASGEDADKDGIDDGCDGEISQAPPEPEPIPTPPINVEPLPPIGLPPVITVPIEELPPAKDGRLSESDPWRNYMPPPEAEEPAQSELQPAVPVRTVQANRAPSNPVTQESVAVETPEAAVLGVQAQTPTPAIQATVMPTEVRRNATGRQIPFYMGGLVLLVLLGGGAYKLARQEDES